MDKRALAVQQLGTFNMHMTTGEVIRRIRKSIGMTQHELGELLNFSQPAVSGLERGGPASHDVRILRLVARALQVPLAILVVESDEEADVDRRQFFRAGALGGTGAAMAAATPSALAGSASGGKIGASDVAAVNESITQLHELDMLVGGDRLCRLAATQVRHVQHLLDTATYTENIGTQLTSASAEMMTAAGWVHYDAGYLEVARRYYADAAQAASAAGDGIAAAHALCNASVIALRDSPRKREGAHLAENAETAVRRGGGPKLRALMAIRQAEAQGALGNTAAMTAAISRAHRAFESGRGYDPEWVYMSEAELSGITGIAQMSFGDHRSATTSLRAAIEGSSAWPRERAAWQLSLAENLVGAGDIAESCSLLSDDFDEIHGLASTRLSRKLDAIATAVRPHATVPEVREFLEMATARG